AATGSERAAKEGGLHKWTNYLSGWQPRWFRLSEGSQLSYYLSKEEVSSGCRGSVNISVCDVLPSQHDPLRFDLSIPGEQLWHLRATTQADRQSWIVAIGSSKACVSNGSGRPDGAAPSAAAAAAAASVPSINARTMELMAQKKSELRLYHSLLRQQLHDLKSQLGEGRVPDLAQLDDTTGLLNATADTFAVALDDCMDLANTIGKPAMPAAATSSRPLPLQHRPLQRPPSKDSSTLASVLAAPTSPIFVANPGEEGVLMPVVTDLSIDSNASTSSTASEAAVDRPPIRRRQPARKRRINTFFSLLPASFEDIRLGPGGDVPVVPFLEACGGLVNLIDIFESTAFLPVRNDVLGNIGKLRAKHDSLSPLAAHALQSLIEAEVRLGHSADLNSACVALLWLNRSILFLQLFISKLCDTNGEDLTQAATEAYHGSLKPYHGWVVRGVFSLVIKALPSRSELLCRLGRARTEPAAEAAQYQAAVVADARCYAGAMAVVTELITKMLIANGLESQQQI
ncbi:hypothetical protein BOX15_Mlig032644g3, partial [Macrostomum lignano]